VGTFSGGDQGIIGFYVSSGTDTTYGDYAFTNKTSGINDVYGIAYSTNTNRYARISGDNINTVPALSPLATMTSDVSSAGHPTFLILMAT